MLKNVHIFHPVGVNVCSLRKNFNLKLQLKEIDGKPQKRAANLIDAGHL